MPKHWVKAFQEKEVIWWPKGDSLEQEEKDTNILVGLPSSSWELSSKSPHSPNVWKLWFENYVDNRIFEIGTLRENLKDMVNIIMLLAERMSLMKDFLFFYFFLQITFLKIINGMCLL